jgi:hypothetical protein
MPNLYKKYWFKGGIISSSIIAILYILGHFGDRIFILDYLYEFKGVIQFMVGVSFCGFMDGKGILGRCDFLSASSSTELIAFFIPLILSVLLFFIVGSIVGLIYGKLKNK